MTSTLLSPLGQKTHSETSKQFRDDVLKGLNSPIRSIPSKYFYDQQGSLLFDQICELQEYYPTRTETRIMQRSAKMMAACIGTNTRLVEYGSGSSVKTRILLDQLKQLDSYLPIDISREHLHTTANNLAVEYPHHDIQPLVGDFTKPINLPKTSSPQTRTCIYFPGSTIGNFTHEEASRLLHSMRSTAGPRGSLLIGFDLLKDKHTLEAAYNDRDGVTAQFNLNVLSRINRELDAQVEVASFDHKAIFNEEAGRIEMRLRSLRNQSIRIDDHFFHINAGDEILTEYSHKYTVEGFTTMADEAGWSCRAVWHDAQTYFAVMYLEG
ncbi:MAG TPA: L-histidine N(alpha)-methyltransferase [Rhodopirellula sp.]|nr:L-histidine N(alpha)-methyltransferase [Rhodopirellula sp.]